MLNGDFTNEQASALAARLSKEAPDDVAGQVKRAVRLTLGRPPTADEIKRDTAFIKELQAENKIDAKAALDAVLPAGAERQ